MQKLGINKLRTICVLFIAIGFALAAAVPIFLGKANAGTLSTRSIQMSDSTPSATGVTYSVTVTPQLAGANNVLGFVLEFCDDSAIDGDACDATAANVPDGTAAAIAGGWSRHANSDANTLIFTIGANQWTGGTPVTLDITGMVNPSSAGSFYARAYSYALAATAQAYTSAAPGTYIDFGGFALSTANVLTIKAKVMERLTFCVWSDTNCAGGLDDIILGALDPVGVLDESADYNNAEARFDVKTNAQGGVVVRAKTWDNALYDHTLTSGGNTITAIGDGGGNGSVSTVGSEQFGFCVVEDGTLVGAEPYDDVNCGADVTTGPFDDLLGNITTFGLDTAATGSTYGDEIANTGTDPTDTRTGRLNFIGNVSVTTEAGIYATQIGLIATGTF